MYRPSSFKRKDSIAFASASFALTATVFLCLASINVVSENRLLALFLREDSIKISSGVPGAIVSSDLETSKTRINLARLKVRTPRSVVQERDRAKKIEITIPALALSHRTGLSRKELEEFVYDSSKLDTSPFPIVRYNPRYPFELKSKWIEGRVVALISVDEAGQVYKVEIENSDNPLFSHSVLEALLKWRFVPGRVAGKNVKFKMRQPIRFSLVENKKDTDSYAKDVTTLQ